MAAADHAGPVEVSAQPVSAFRVRYPAERVFGALEWIGGLVLTSPDPRFGGFSGVLTVDEGRRILAVSDTGAWLSARIEEDADGAPAGVRDAFMAPIIDVNGRPIDDKHLGDAEGLTQRAGRGGAEYLVSFEGKHRILAFKPDGGKPGGLPDGKPARKISMPAEIARLNRNKGLEALVSAPAASPLAGNLVAIAEEGPEGDPRIPGWIFGAGETRRFFLAKRDGFDVTDAAFLPDGDLLVLERRFNFSEGIGMRLRRFSARGLAGGGVLDGDIVMEADLRHQIDNMEGLDVHRDASGATILTLISDDNHIVLQRTMLLRFRLTAAADASPAMPRTPAMPRAKP